MWPPPYPVWSAELTKEFYLQDITQKRFGLAICISVWILMLPWSLVLASLTARAERGFRVLSLTGALCGAGIVVVGYVMFFLWGVNMFRPDIFAAESMQMFNDLGWFIFVMFWSPGTVWCWAVGLTIILDPSSEPAFPRWVAYVNFWVGLCFFPACTGLFFKEGPFAYDGIFTVWLPASVFFVWYGLMTVLMLRAINRTRSSQLSLP